jgi:hypothetical protein
MANQNNEADTRFEIRAGALVVATDGEVGRTDGVLVGPANTAGVLGVRNDLGTSEALSEAVRAAEHRGNRAAGPRRVGPA